MPGFNSHAHFHLDPLQVYSTIMRKTEFKKRFKPAHLKRITGIVEISHHFPYVLMHIKRKHKFIVKVRSPSYQIMLIRVLPEPGDESGDEQHLQNAH